MNLRLFALALAVSLPVPVLAQAPTAPAPEVAATVDAFVGTWTFVGTLTGAPGTKGPVKVQETFTCSRAAGGRAAHCSGQGSAEGLGEVEDEALVAYDEGTKAVRFIGLSSMGDVHDHACAWKSAQSLTCEPLAVTVEGQSATVEFSATWTDPKTLKINETTIMKDGSKVVFEGSGTRP